MSRPNKWTSYIVYGVIVVCSVFVISRSMIKMFQHKDSLPIYDDNHASTENTRKRDPITDVTTSPTAYKVGEVPKGTIIEHTFSIKNTGNNPLVIYDIIPDCTCTDCVLSQKLIMPEENATITVTVDTKGKHGIFVVNIILRANSHEGAHRFSLTGCVV